ncbi:MAG: N-6 DNA methylase, partial [bacterium]
TGRIMYLKYQDYVKEWPRIVEIFSREAILKGSFDKFVTSSKNKRGTSEVDETFLSEIEGWRDVLARNLALRNPQLNQRELNYSVQRTIDRIIFLRICEDRGIEPYGQLQALQNGNGTYAKLCEIFVRADDRYNSGIFHFHSERGRPETPDELSFTLQIDDKILKDIFKRLYYPDSPYEFSVLPADILGKVYEQFLGKVIRLTVGHQAKVEEKPEVKKAGGVFYTPTYIVDYIVEHTVGKLVEGKTPKEVASLRILDPACGSGSFLIGAYQFLLDWHLQWYLADGAEKHTRGKNAPLLPAEGGWRLTTSERKRILINNIYGVDIDGQAVEVTKLSLLLKVLEGETTASLDHQVAMFRQRALPDLGANIKCGNSLIGSDFYDNQQFTMLDEEEMYRVNAFDWGSVESGFGKIMKDGGFDAVIGNPPYGFHQIHADNMKPYFRNNFEAAHGSYEHYFLFYEGSLKLLREGGFHGFIVPVTWLTIPTALSLRKFVLQNYQIREISWLPELVFKNAQVNTLISIITKSTKGEVVVNIYDSLGFIKPPKEKRTYQQEQFIQSNFFIGIFEEETDLQIMDKIACMSQSLMSFASPCSGYNPYEVGKGQDPKGGPHTLETVKTKPYHSTEQLSSAWKSEIVGRDLGRYSVNVTGKRWIKYGPWLAAPRKPSNFMGQRILVQEITGGKERRIIAASYNGELYHSRDVIPIKIDKSLPHPMYLLGIINSRLITWYHHIKSPKAQKALFPKVLVSDIENLPIRTIDFTKPADMTSHDHMVALVERMLDLNKRLAAAKVEQEQTVLRRQIEAIDKQIDALVYELYGLTEEEIGIVEGS